MMADGAVEPLIAVTTVAVVTVEGVGDSTWPLSVIATKMLE